MEKKPEEMSDDEMEISDNPELKPLQNINLALNKRMRVSSSLVQLVRNDPDTYEFVSIEGNPDPPTLQVLKESLADLISFPDCKSAKSEDLISEGETCSILASESFPKSDNVGKSSLKAGSSFSIPSCTSSFDESVDLEALQKAEEAIVDMSQNGPTGLVQLSSLSAAIKKPIRVLQSNEEILKVGRTKTGKPIDVEYHKAVHDQKYGHWTLPGNKEPKDVEGQINDCLFSVVGDQTGHLAPELRAATTALMRKNIKSLAKRIEKIAELEKCDRIKFMIGGARYTGSRPQDARTVIDNSQKGRCDPQKLYGHPRGHTSHPEATGETESAENYSYSGRKSAFLSREDQDAVGHLALKTEQAQRAMQALNRGSVNEAIHVSPHELEPGALPDCVWFSQGQREGSERPFKDLVLVLRHHEGQRNNPDADVFVHTFYPRPQ